MMGNRQLWACYLRFRRNLSRYGVSGLRWRAMEDYELYQAWLDGLITTGEAIRIYWHIQVNS